MFRGHLLPGSLCPLDGRGCLCAMNHCISPRRHPSLPSICSRSGSSGDHPLGSFSLLSFKIFCVLEDRTQAHAVTFLRQGGTPLVDTMISFALQFLFGLSDWVLFSPPPTGTCFLRFFLMLVSWFLFFGFFQTQHCCPTSGRVPFFSRGLPARVTAPIFWPLPPPGSLRRPCLVLPDFSIFRRKGFFLSFFDEGIIPWTAVLL